MDYCQCDGYNYDYADNPFDHYKPGRKCRQCKAISGPEKPFYTTVLCRACYRHNRGHREGLTCQDCGATSGRRKPPFATKTLCKACDSRRRTHQEGLTCQDCGALSGPQKSFATSSLCWTCYKQRSRSDR